MFSFTPHEDNNCTRRFFWQPYQATYLPIDFIRRTHFHLFRISETPRPTFKTISIKALDLINLGNEFPIISIFMLYSNNTLIRIDYIVYTSEIVITLLELGKYGKIVPKQFHLFNTPWLRWAISSK